MTGQVVMIVMAMAETANIAIAFLMVEHQIYTAQSHFLASALPEISSRTWM